MFTGIIECCGQVRSVQRLDNSMRLDVDLGKCDEGSKIGDSICVNGVCLTITTLQAGIGSFDVSGETLDKSTLRNIQAGSLVNLERAMRADGRFGGHIVQGHIDGTAKIKKIEPQGQFARITFDTPEQLLEQMVAKGAVAIDGISLTIADIDDRCFWVAVIPETLKRTTLSRGKPADEVNIEIDIIAKLVKRHLGRILPEKDKLSIEKLQQMGF